MFCGCYALLFYIRVLIRHSECDLYTFDSNKGVVGRIQPIKWNRLTHAKKILNYFKDSVKHSPKGWIVILYLNKIAWLTKIVSKEFTLSEMFIDSIKLNFINLNHHHRSVYSYSLFVISWFRICITHKWSDCRILPKLL